MKSKFQKPTNFLAGKRKRKRKQILSRKTLIRVTLGKCQLKHNRVSV
jgi:hypothetical protein